MGWNHGNPVVGIGLLVIVIVRIVEELVSVIIGVDLGLWIKVLEHLGISISVSQLRIVVERNSGEWVEVIWINWLGLWHSSLVSDSLFSSGISRPLSVDEPGRSKKSWIEGKVGNVVHSSESGECI